MKETRPITGRSVFFTLCGPLLRLWYTDPAKLGTSTAYSFKNPKDFLKIVHIIAYLSGPVTNVLEQWEPRRDQIIEIKMEDSTRHEYRVGDVRVLAVSPTIWGRRTAVWSLEVEPLNQSSPSAPYPEMKMVIKSTWLPARLHEHELEVMRWYDNPGAGKMPGVERPKRLPKALGLVRDNTAAVDPDDWRTMIEQDDRRNSTIATWSFEAFPLTDMTNDREYLRVYRGLLESLQYIILTGVHIAI
jgi:hypothetical protein